MNPQEVIWNKLYKSRLIWKKEAVNLPNLLTSKSVLEIGVGTGKTLISVLKQNPKSVTAIDFSEEALSKAKELIKSGKAEFIKANLLDFQSDEKFDVVVCYYVLNNLLELEREKAVDAMHRLLNKEGIIIFEDFAVGDFREKESSKLIESHTIERRDGLICHFFTKPEIKLLFKSFKGIKASEKTFSPLRSNPEIKRRILSAVIIS